LDQHEEFFYCPHCAQRISVLVDLSVPEQKYIEDCEICCRPMQITYEVFKDEITVLKLILPEDGYNIEKLYLHFYIWFFFDLFHKS